MKMYGYIAKDKSLLFVRSKREYVLGSFLGHIKRKYGIKVEEASKYITENFDEVVIEYNEVT